MKWGPPRPRPEEPEHPFVAVLDYQGITIDVEHRKGGIRSGVDPDGTPWSVRMPATYGEVRGTVGADGDAVDVYVGDDPYAPFVYVVQAKLPGKKAFDETKSFLGFRSRADALATFRRAYTVPGFLHGCTRWPFAAWKEAMSRPHLARGRLTRPLVKSRVKAHMRVTASGKVVRVHEHERKGAPRHPDELVEHIKAKVAKHGHDWNAAMHIAGQELFPDEWPEGPFRVPPGPAFNGRRAALIREHPDAWAQVADKAEDHLEAGRAVVKGASKAARAAERKEKADRRYEAQGLDLEESGAPLSRLRGRKVWLYHGTTTSKLDEIKAKGLTTGHAPSNYGNKADPDAVQSQVFLTARTTGPASAEFYAKNAARRHGGEPVVLRVLVDGDDLDHDPDDDDLTAGSYQFVTRGVDPSEIMEIDGERVKLAKADQLGLFEARVPVVAHVATGPSGPHLVRGHQRRVVARLLKAEPVPPPGTRALRVIAFGPHAERRGTRTVWVRGHVDLRGQPIHADPAPAEHATPEDGETATSPDGSPVVDEHGNPVPGEPDAPDRPR